MVTTFSYFSFRVRLEKLKTRALVCSPRPTPPLPISVLSARKVRQLSLSYLNLCGCVKYELNYTNTRIALWPPSSPFFSLVRVWAWLGPLCLGLPPAPAQTAEMGLA